MKNTFPTIDLLQESAQGSKQFMKRVIAYGTFDLLHYGHIILLRRT